MIGGQLARRSRSPRQALEWMPLEIVPDDTEQGYSTVQLNPETDPKTGTTTYTVNGYSRDPTVEDGYRVSVTIELDPTGGPAVTRLVIEPSRTVTDADDVHRPREPHEKRLSPVNSSVLSLVKFTEILNRLIEVEQGFAEFMAEKPERRKEIQQRLDRMRQRRPRKDPAKAAEHAEDVLAAMRSGRGYQARLKDEWSIGLEGVKKRVSRLRQDGWLHTDYSRPGKTLVAWRALLETDDSETPPDREEE